MIRKTLSVSTFGLVSFRSTQEQLQRASGRASAQSGRSSESTSPGLGGVSHHGGRAPTRSRTDAAQYAAEHFVRREGEAKRPPWCSKCTKSWTTSSPRARRARAVAKRSARDARRNAEPTIVTGARRRAVDQGSGRADVERDCVGRGRDRSRLELSPRPRESVSSRRVTGTVRSNQGGSNMYIGLGTLLVILLILIIIGVLR